MNEIKGEVKVESTPAHPESSKNVDKTTIDPKVLTQYIERLRGALAYNLDWDTALVALAIPVEMITTLEEHPEIISMRKQMKAILELELLELHSKARRVAAAKGQGRPIEWLLEQIRPEKYGKQGGGIPTNPTMVHDDL